MPHSNSTNNNDDIKIANIIESTNCNPINQVYVFSLFDRFKAGQDTQDLL